MWCGLAREVSSCLRDMGKGSWKGDIWISSWRNSTMLMKGIATPGHLIFINPLKSIKTQCKLNLQFDFWTKQKHKFLTHQGCLVHDRGTLKSLLDCKEIKPVNPKGNQPRKFMGRTDAEAEAPILQPPDAKRWHWKRLMLGKMEGNRRRGQQRMKWRASLTQQTWIWANFRRNWGTGKPGVLQSMGSQRVGHDLVTEQRQ